MLSIAARLVMRWLRAFLIPRPVVGILYLPRFFWHWIKYARRAKGHGPKLGDMYPCLTDWTRYTPFDPHYFYQGAWLARRVQHHRPKVHVDVGSSVMTIGTVSAQVYTVFVDYRPARANLEGLTPVAGNIVSLPFAANALQSLSCLHVIEHIGLGRYGDPLDPTGSIKAAEELSRVLAPGGMLYLSAPVGRERVEFNAHRVFAPRNVLGMFRGLELLEFSYVDDAGMFREFRTPEDASDSDYACGMFRMRKPLTCARRIPLQASS